MIWVRNLACRFFKGRAIIRIADPSRVIDESHLIIRLRSTSVGIASTSDDVIAERKGLEDLPLPTNKWKMIKSFVSTGSRDIERLYEETNEIPNPICRLPIPFSPYPFVLISSPEYVEMLMRKEGTLPRRTEGELFKFMKQKGFGPGMIVSNWEEWQSIRSKANPQVVPRKVLEFAPLIYGVADDLMKHLWDQRGLDGYVSDVREPLIDWAMEEKSLDQMAILGNYPSLRVFGLSELLVYLLNREIMTSIGIFILGQRMNIFTNPSPRMLQFRNAGITFIDCMAPMLSPFSLYKYFPTPTSIRFENVVNYLQEISGEFITERMTKLMEATQRGEKVEAVSFLDQWLLDENISTEDIHMLTRDFLAAGMDTTSTAGAYLLYELAKNQDVQEKLRREVLSVVGPEGIPTPQTLQKLPYAKNTIKEILRYHPITSGNLRHLPEETQFGEYVLPKGTAVVISSLSFNRSSSIYEEPHRFNPDRWNDRETRRFTAFSNIPFGFGPRACYGRRLAELELLMLLVKVAQDLHLETDQKGFKVEGTTVLKPMDPIRLKLTKI